MATSIRELCESRDSEYTNFFDRNESHLTSYVLHKLIIHILYFVCILVICVILLFFYPLHLYVFVLICQYYVVLLERTNKDIIYRPISLLCHTLLERTMNRLNPTTENTIIKEQAGFRAGKSCTSQLLNLTQYIEDGCEKSLTTGTVFVDLSAAYDTVNHRVLLTKLYGMTEDAEFTKHIGSMMRNRRFYVELNGKKSRWCNQKNSLPQGSVLSPVLFNVYTNDQTIHNETRSFIYADDMCIATQRCSFQKT